MIDTRNTHTRDSAWQVDEALKGLAERLKAQQRDEMRIDGFRRAAILVPLLLGEDEPALLFTVRSSLLRSHAGQISFPGGRVDAGESIVDAAIRETREETGLHVSKDSIIGYLHDHPSPAQYVVTPVVASLSWPQPLTLNTAEVESVFTVPISALRTLQPRSEERQLKQYKRRIYFYEWQDKTIWGLTGNVVKNLLELLDV